MLESLSRSGEFKENGEEESADNEESEEDEVDEESAMVCSCTLGGPTVIIEVKKDLEEEKINYGVTENQEEEKEEDNEEEGEAIQSTLVIQLPGINNRTPRISILDTAEQKQEPLKEQEQEMEQKWEEEEKSGDQNIVQKTENENTVNHKEEDLLPEKKQSVLQRLLGCFHCFHR